MIYKLKISKIKYLMLNHLWISNTERAFLLVARKKKLFFFPHENYHPLVYLFYLFFFHNLFKIFKNLLGMTCYLKLVPSKKQPHKIKWHAPLVCECKWVCRDSRVCSQFFFPFGTNNVSSLLGKDQWMTTLKGGRKEIFEKLIFSW